MKNRNFNPTRTLHKWLGVACFLFVIVLSVTGILLMHVDSLELGKKMVDGKFLPKKYFNLTGVSRSIQSLAYIPNDKQSIIFAGTDHGLFRTIDSGKSWVESKKGLFNQDIRALAVDPNDSRLIYAGTPKGIFKSWDSGESWSDWYDQASGLTNTFICLLYTSPSPRD